MEVSDRELGAGDVDGEVDFGAAGEVLDVAVPSVFRTTLGLLSVYFSVDMIVWFSLRLINIQELFEPLLWLPCL